MSYELLISLGGIIALIFAGYKYYSLQQQTVSSAKAQEIATAIHRGAMAFLNRQYRVLAIFVVVTATIMLLTQFVFEDGKSISTATVIAFVVGSVLSALAGNIGMRVATIANIRTAEAAQKNLAAGLTTAFSAGSVSGLSVVGLVILGIMSLWYLWHDPAPLYGLAFGASAVGLFARVGGGIYTKAADVGADLVGKVEKGIPEDDPRNPAVIADNVGDNVGDVAGMGADLFESYIDVLVAAMGLGLIAYKSFGDIVSMYPLLIAALGVVATIVGVFVVRTDKEDGVSSAMSRGVLVTAAIVAVGTWILTDYLFGSLSFFWAVGIGLVAGMLIGLLTEYYTSNQKKPAQRVAEAARTGAATNIIAGLGLGMGSTAIMVIVLSVAILLSFNVAGVYGVALAAVGMLSIVGMILAADTYGPVADNAAGIAEMAGMGAETRRRAEALDAVGNTTAAVGKGFAVGSAVLAALALLVSYAEVTHLEAVNLIKPHVMVGLFIGGMLPFVMAAMLLQAVGKSAMDMVEEVRRQFRSIAGLMEGTAKPDYERCVSIATDAALRQMIVPGIIAVVAPVIVGFVLGKEALGGMLGSSIVTGFLVAVMMANAGGAWDNAKKYIEAGNLGGKGSDVHKAAVVGDTVGDPFKDTAGPAVNVLIKLMSIVALVIAPLL